MFRLFGPFEVWHDGVRVDPGDLQQRYVLVILLLNANRAVSREYLQEYVWLGQDQPKSDLITSYVARLRRVFKDAGMTDGDNGVVIGKTPTGYVLRLDESLIDTVRFGQLCDKARRADKAEAVRLFTEALDLWRGRFLSDLDIDRVGGTAMAPLDDARVDALVDLAALELAAGRHRVIRDRLRPVWEEERSQQRLAAMLMRALIANGDQVRAVEVFHQTRDALEEYGMETARELRDMAWIAQYGERLSSLPARLAPFTGRREELAAVDEAARSAREEPAVLWISGMPGVGKTALAVHAAHLLANQFPGARLFVELNGFTPNVAPTDPADALERLLTDLGVPPEAIPPSTRARSELYRSKLTDTRTLVVLDNAASEAQIEPLLPGVAGCLAVVTSRELGGLAGSEHVHLEPLPHDEAAELFGKLVSPDRVRGRIDQVREVINRCGRVPLLIHLVAAQFRRHLRWPLDHLVELLRAASPMSAHSSFTDTATVACTVSYQQLTEPQRELFRLFGQVPGPDLSAHGAAALIASPVPDARALLEDLHRVSLIEESVPERFHMLDPLRDYVTTALPVPARDVDERLLDFYLSSAGAAMAALFPFDRDHQPSHKVDSPTTLRFPDQAAALSWLDDERRNLVAAIDHAAAHDRPDHTWKLAILLWRYFYTGGHQRDWNATLQRARSVLAGTGDTRWLAEVLWRLSIARRRSGASTEARTLAAEALPLWEALDDPRGEAGTLVALASAAHNLGDQDEAARCFAAALDRYERIGDERGQAHALDNLGVASEVQGHLDLAERQHADAVRLLRKIEHTQGLAHALDNLGGVHQRLGRVEEALTEHLEARELAISIGDRAVEAYALNNIGNAHRLADRLDDATRYQQQARRVADLVIDPNLRTQLYLDRGTTAWARRDDRAALHAFRAALDMAAGTGESAQAARANHRIGEVLHETGQHEPATPHWHDALTDYTRLGLPEADQVRTELSGLACTCAGAL
ncbi:MAG: tetratricopeptide repeat protein [Actinophytocola sp.]|uniref:AfsR/SARP family transcriptional regulator n=1 Tax=Actinophytocola sp. TaxID=1872138 RepID=UPI003D6A6D03